MVEDDILFRTIFSGKHQQWDFALEEECLVHYISFYFSWSLVNKWKCMNANKLLTSINTEAGIQ